MHSDDEDNQPQASIDDAQLAIVRRRVREAFESASSPTRWFDVLYSLRDVPQLLDELALLRAENARLWEWYRANQAVTD